MKRFKEFLYLFVPYFILTALQILLFVLSDTDGFFGNSYLIKLLISPSLIIVLFNNFIMFGIPSLLLTGIFAFVIRKKKNDIGRRKYYIYLFLISLMAPIIIILILTGKYDFINHTIFTTQTGILVVFIHWVIEWIAEKIRKKKRCKLMKRFLAVIISLILCFSMVGCGNHKNAVQLDETVLNKDFEFYNTEYKTTMTLSEYLDYLQDSSHGGSCFYINEYTLFDLDFDGNNELICRLGIGEDKYFGTLVFHAIENTIYSYDFTWRQFGELKTDGTVSYSQSGFDYGFRTLTFDKEGYNSKSSTYSEGVWGDRDIIGMNYYINDKKTTEEKFKKAYEKHNKLDDVKFERFYLDKNTFKYLDFISLKTKGLDREGNEIDFDTYIQDVLPVKSISDEFISYGFYDMNHDGIVEMSVVSSGIYAYFTIKNDVVTAWSDIQSMYTYPLENGNLMFERHGGAPSHINYEYYELDFDGNIIKTISFNEWHPTADDGGEEEYFFNDNSVTKDEYSRLTKKYLDYEKAPIEWFDFDELIFQWFNNFNELIFQ